MINKLPSTSPVNPALTEQKDGATWNTARPERDVFVSDRSTGKTAEVAFRDAARLYRTRQAEAAKGPEEELVSTYPNRNGYDENFLGKPLPLPTLGPAIRDKAAHRLDQPDKVELEYTNFSIVMNKERRQPFVTAANIDGSQSKDIPRDGQWTIDGRIAREFQLGNEAYKNNDIDKGHMVRRQDPAWGPQAHQASNDTFSYTNASLQHTGLNQKEWLELEDHVLGSAKALGQKMTVLTGPIFREDDPKFDNKGAINPPTQIPQKFYKVVVWNDPKQGLKGAAFVLSQEDLIKGGGLYKGGEFSPDRFKVYQVPLDKLQQMTQMDFGPIANVTSETREISAENGQLPIV